MRGGFVRWLVAVAAAVLATSGSQSSPALVTAQIPDLPDGLDIGIEEPEAEEDGGTEGGSGSGATTPKPVTAKPKPKRDPNKPFFKIKKVQTMEDPMEGWTPIVQETDMPEGYCFDETLNAVACDANFISFATHGNTGFPSYVHAISADGPVPFSLIFGADSLFRFSTEAGKLLLFNKKGNKYVALDKTTMAFVVAEKDKAAKFEVFMRMGKSAALLLKTGDSFVRLSPDGLTASAFVTHECFLLPAKTDAAKVEEIADKLDAEALGRRAGALTKGAKPVPMWFAYDFALVVPLDGKATYAKFSMLQGKKVDVRSLKAGFEKAFELICEKMLFEYKAFPSLGQKLPQLLMVHNLDQVETVDPSVWITVSNYFTSSSKRTINDGVANTVHFSALVFANAKWEERKRNKERLSTKEEKDGAWLASYFRSSCALAWNAEGLTLEKKLELVDMLDASVPQEDPDQLQTFWFTSLINGTSEQVKGKPDEPMSPLKSSLLLIELGLMHKLDPNFLATNSYVGESIAKPLFQQLDVYLKSETGMDLDGVYKLVKDKVTKDAMHVIDSVCSARLLEISVCVLPQIFRQAGIFSMYDRNITSPDVITDLKNAAAIDQVAYLDLVRSDKADAKLNKELLKIKEDYVTAAKTFTDGLSEIVEDITIQGALDASDKLAKTTTALATYMEKSSQFRASGINADLARKVRDIEAASAEVTKSQASFTKNIRKIGDIATFRAAIDAFVAVVETAFTAFEAASSFGSGGVSGAVGGIGEVSNSLKTLISKINDAADTIQLVEYASALTKELGELLVKMNDALPAINAVREAAKPLTSGQEMTAAQFAMHSQKFLEALRGYKAPVSATQLNSLQARFRGVAEMFCRVAQIPTKSECVELPGQNMLIFTNLVENVRLGEEVMQGLMEMCTEAVNARTLTMLKEKVEANKAAATNFDDLKAKWGKDNKKKQTWWFQWRKQQQYLTAAATAASVLQEVYLLSSIVDRCNQMTYSRGGIPVPACESVYSGEPISASVIDELIESGDEEPQYETVEKEPFIPTAPAYSGDVAYIDLPKLMEGMPVYFKLPSNNASWLLAHQWISSEDELETNAMYVTQFKLQIPPRFANYDSEASTAEIVIESRQESMLGPALAGKTFLINPVRFASDYTLDAEQNDGAAGCVYVYECDANIPKYCFNDDGTTADKITVFPSMFTEWSIIASITTDSAKPPRIGYSKAATPLLLRAHVTVNKVPLDGESFSRRRQRRLRGRSDKDDSAEPASHGSGQCCAGKNDYRAIVDGDFTCVPCPEGTIKQLGGLYCAADPRAVKKGAIKGAADADGDDSHPDAEVSNEERRY